MALCNAAKARKATRVVDLHFISKSNTVQRFCSRRIFENQKLPAPQKRQKCLTVNTLMSCIFNTQRMFSCYIALIVVLSVNVLVKKMFLILLCNHLFRNICFAKMTFSLANKSVKVAQMSCITVAYL